MVNDAIGRYSVEKLHDRVSVLEPGILLMREIADGDGTTLSTMLQRVEELATGLDRYGLVIDLDGAKGRISSDYRREVPRQITAFWQRSDGRLCVVAVTMLTNPVTRVVAKFIIGRIGVPIEITPDQEASVACVRERLAR